MTTEDDLNDLQVKIAECELELAALRKEYRERRTSALRSAIDARNEADRMVAEEMKKLGYASARHLSMLTR